MQNYQVDIDPEQVVRWALAEREAAPTSLRLHARRSSEMREIPTREELHLGDEERQDLSEVATVATLEIAPWHASEGWLLTVVVEDESGPRIPAEGTGIESDQRIDPGTFYSQYIRPGRGTATVIAEAENPAALALMTRLLREMEMNRHQSEGRKAGSAQ
jgi:hypothetical protein